VIGSGPLLLRSTSATETRAAAAVLASLSRPGDVLLLSGGLGAGKTTFAQGFGAGLGVREAITSPTFTMVRRYPVDRRPVTAFIHADVYRLDHLGEVVDLGLGELVGDTGVALVEWGDVAEPVLGTGGLTVRLEPVPDHDDHRRITVGPAESWSERWAALRRALAGWRWGR
jgi:tRNA threonylcarbamoyladenosine biosynthesis protein TsaE